MPTYDYKCKKCGHLFEKFQNITEEPLKKCPKKGCKGTVQRVISKGAGFIFKGSGFYITDYRSDSYKKAAEADKSKPSDTKKSTKNKKADTKKQTTSKSTEKKSGTSKKSKS